MAEQLPAVSIEVAEFWAQNGARKERNRIIELLKACECGAESSDDCLCEYRPMTRWAVIALIEGETE